MTGNETTPTPPDAEPALVDRRAERQRRRRWIVGGAIGAVVVAVVAVIALNVGGDDATAAAGQTPPPADASDAPTGASDEPAGGTDPDAVVTVGLTLEPSNLDIRTTSGVALDQVLIDNVYEGLVSRTVDGDVAPSLAAEWEVSEDALTYTFNLVEGVTFSNGNALTSEDAVWSIRQVIDEELRDADLLASVDEITAPDETTVEITVTQPDPNLLWALSGRAGLVLDSEATNDLKSSAIGSGPFLLTEWKQGDAITFERNDDYWADPAGVAGVVFRYLTDENAAVNALNSGDLDVLAPIVTLLRDQVEADGVELVEGEASDTFVLAFNNGVEPFTDLRVRQAIRYAIDHEALVVARGGVDALLGGPIAPGDPGYEDLTGLYPYDPERATALLADAGYDDGLELELVIPSFYGTTFPDLLTSQLAAVGITLTTRSVEFPAWLEDVYTNKDYQLSIVDHAESRDFASWADPDYYFAYDNAEVQDLFAQSQVALTPEESSALLAQAARIVSEDAAGDWLTNFRTLTAVRESVQGFPTDYVNARLDLSGLTVAAG